MVFRKKTVNQPIRVVWWQMADKKMKIHSKMNFDNRLIDIEESTCRSAKIDKSFLSIQR